MRIIREPFLVEMAAKYPQAAHYLNAWRGVVRKASWNSLNDVRNTYSGADGVKVASGRTVVVFNVCGNHYRLIVAFHYNRGIAYTLRFLTHAEYSKDRWKEEL